MDAMASYWSGNTSRPGFRVVFHNGLDRVVPGTRHEERGESVFFFEPGDDGEVITAAISKTRIADIVQEQR